MTTPCDLSFCIPTYNFGQFIGQTLDSIIAQADAGVEIVIVDGGSNDNTAEVVAERSRIFPRIRFIQRAERSGVDRDILESVAQARGEFCWLFSSDDVLLPGAVARVRQQLHSGCNVLLVDHTLCDRQLKPREKRGVFAPDADATFHWSRPAERARYLSMACGTTAFFSFISAVVVRRADWVGIPPQSQFLGSCWIIAAQLFALSQRGLIVRYLADELVAVRGENDSFLSQGWVRRLGLSIDGFRSVAEYYFGVGSPEARHVSRVLKREIPLNVLISCRLRLQDPAEQRRLAALVQRHYADRTIRDRLYRVAGQAPLLILKSVRWLVRRAKAASNVARSLVTGICAASVRALSRRLSRPVQARR